MNQATYPTRHIGSKVITVETNCTSEDWTASALKKRKFNVAGEIIGYSDSHGIVYEVRHADGSVGCYDPWELDTIRDECNTFHASER